MSRAFTEYLVIAGAIQRTYYVTAEGYPQTILDLWAPLVERLMERPNERQYHGMPGLPYWDVSMSPSPMLAHPDLELGQWLCFYGSPESVEPYYVGLLAERSQDDCVAMIVAISGCNKPSQIEKTTHAINQFPALIGTYWAAGFGEFDAELAARSTGECAAIIAQIILG